jgi:hypothetical protein
MMAREEADVPDVRAVAIRKEAKNSTMGREVAEAEQSKREC